MRGAPGVGVRRRAERGSTMAGDSADPGPLRLEVLAALIDYDAPASSSADSWVHGDGMPYTADEAALIATASMAEWSVAEALRGGPEEVSDPDQAVIAALLRLARAPPPAPLVGIGLREAFPPDGDGPERTRPERTAAFADVYRRLALPGLADDTSALAIRL